jgi:hypothetical protein
VHATNTNISTDATPKYCCPRCSTRTCSLQCYKRHQLWSQCSGKRDPGAYVKRSQLATAAGIDRDFNFLTGIERAFDAADRESESRGITSSGKRGTGPNPGSNLQQRLNASGAIIRKAPVGMSRQKSNRTQWMPKLVQTQFYNRVAHGRVVWFRCYSSLHRLSQPSGAIMMILQELSLIMQQIQVYSLDSRMDPSRWHQNKWTMP